MMRFLRKPAKEVPTHEIHSSQDSHNSHNGHEGSRGSRHDHTAHAEMSPARSPGSLLSNKDRAAKIFAEMQRSDTRTGTGMAINKSSSVISKSGSVVSTGPSRVSSLASSQGDATTSPLSSVYHRRALSHKTRSLSTKRKPMLARSRGCTTDDPPPENPESDEDDFEDGRVMQALRRAGSHKAAANAPRNFEESMHPKTFKKFDERAEKAAEEAIRGSTSVVHEDPSTEITRATSVARVTSLGVGSFKQNRRNTNQTMLQLKTNLLERQNKATMDSDVEEHGKRFERLKSLFFAPIQVRALSTPGGALRRLSHLLVLRVSLLTAPPLV